MTTERGVDDWCWQWGISPINLLPGLLKYSVMDRPRQSPLVWVGHLFICLSLPSLNRWRASLSQTLNLLNLNHRYLRWCLAHDGPCHTRPSHREKRERFMDFHNNSNNKNSQHSYNLYYVPCTFLSAYL